VGREEKTKASHAETRRTRRKKKAREKNNFTAILRQCSGAKNAKSTNKEKKYLTAKSAKKILPQRHGDHREKVKAGQAESAESGKSSSVGVLVRKTKGNSDLTLDSC
jgi:hypothetical protein